MQARSTNLTKTGTYHLKNDNKMKLEGNHLTADNGKILRRKGTEEIFGEEIWLGYSHYIDGVKLAEPHLDVPDDFEEIDDPEKDRPPEE